MNKYLEGVKKRVGIVILFGQMCIIIYQLGILDAKKVIICRLDTYNQQIICVEQ